MPPGGQALPPGAPMAGSQGEPGAYREWGPARFRLIGACALAMLRRCCRCPSPLRASSGTPPRGATTRRGLRRPIRGSFPSRGEGAASGLASLAANATALLAHPLTRPPPCLSPPSHPSGPGCDGGCALHLRAIGTCSDFSGLCHFLTPGCRRQWRPSPMRRAGGGSSWRPRSRPGSSSRARGQARAQGAQAQGRARGLRGPRPGSGSARRRTRPRRPTSGLCSTAR